MSREIHVRFWEGVGVRFPHATRLVYRRPGIIQSAGLVISYMKSPRKISPGAFRCNRSAKNGIRFFFGLPFIHPEDLIVLLISTLLRRLVIPLGLLRIVRGLVPSVDFSGHATPGSSE